MEVTPSGDNYTCTSEPGGGTITLNMSGGTLVSITVSGLTGQYAPLNDTYAPAP